MLFDMCCGEYGEQLEVVAEVGVDEHCSRHAADGEVRAFSNAIFGRGIGYCFLICYAIGFAELLHLSVDEFRGVVDSEK